MSLVRVLLVAAIAAAAAVGTRPAAAQPKQPPATPWGVSSSASAFRNHAEWFPRVAAAGVTSVRLFPEWRGVEPRKGTWRWDDADALVKSAAASGVEITGILMGSPPDAKAAHAFPMDDLDGWAGYVAGAVGRYKQIKYWEVWNEGNGGFNDGKHTTADYAKLAAVTYAAGKKANPDARIGLSVASFDAPYLDQAVRAMAKAGTPGRFDHLCIHPYEIADGLAEPDGEVPYLWMTKLLRDLLKTSAPDKVDAEIWITEVGSRVEKTKHRTVTDEEAAAGLVKLYTMALAQGIARVQWFEAQDPVGEDQGFGLIERGGKERPAYHALKGLTAALGPAPKYLGWVAPGEAGRAYGFIFEGKAGPVLVAWLPKGGTDRTAVVNGVSLTDTPVVAGAVPPAVVEQARANAGRPFPWGGNYAAARAVSLRLGAEEKSEGVALVGRRDRPVVRFADGTSGVLLEGDIGHPISLYVHPSFASIGTREYYVRATVRRVAPGNVGMNLLYEVADSQGRGPYANTGRWFGTTADAGWQTHTWRVTDACFSKMWGYDITLRPEQSIPFALGRVEVSTRPFE